MQKLLFGFSFALIIGVLAGCATGYSSTNFTGGYSDTQLAPDVFRVKFNGNGYTSQERAQDFALLRAADLTQANGFTLFAVINESDQSVQESYTTPGTINTYGSYNSNTGYYSATSFYDPGVTYNFFKPRTGMLIRCFHEVQPGIYTFNAAFIENSIRTKYKLPPQNAKT
jgi:hypothetical protein